MKGNKHSAEDSMRRLFELAIQTAKEKPRLAQRYAKLALTIGMRTKTRLPREYRNLVCKGCGKPIIPGMDSRVRIQPRREPHIAITCLNCGRVKRIPLSDRKKRIADS